MEDKAIVSVTLSSPHPSQRSTQIITHRFLYARVQADFSSLMSSWSSSDIWCAVKSICTFYTLKRNHKAKPPLQSSTLPHIRLMELSVTQTTLPQPVSAVCDVLISLSLSGPAIHTNPRLSWLHYTIHCYTCPCLLELSTNLWVRREGPLPAKIINSMWFGYQRFLKSAIGMISGQCNVKYRESWLTALLFTWASGPESPAAWLLLITCTRAEHRSALWVECVN